MKKSREKEPPSDSPSTSESSEETKLGKSPAQTPKREKTASKGSSLASSAASSTSRKTSTGSGYTSNTSATSSSSLASTSSAASSPAIIATARSPSSPAPSPAPSPANSLPKRSHLKPMSHLKTAKTLSTTSVTSIGGLAGPAIKLRTYREDYYMALSAFLKVSTQTLGENYIPPVEDNKSDKTDNENMSICLYEYDVQAVRALADFVHNDGTHTNLKVPPSALIDLLELSEVFCIQLLTQSVHNWILQSATKSVSQLAHALQLLSDNRIRACPVGGKLFTLALSHFRSLPQAHTFTSLSPAMLVEILDACELPAKTEVEVFDIILRYLHRRNDRLLIAYELVSCVRQSRISDVYRRWMVDALGRLPQGEQLKAIVAMVINEENAFRCCVLKEHRNFIRCGELPREVRGCRFTIFSNKIDLEGVAHKPGDNEHDNPFKTRSGRIFINKEIPKKSFRAERRALREIQRLKDEAVNKRILAGLEK